MTTVVDSHDLNELVQRVFVDPPHSPHSIQLELTNASTQHDVFKMLGQLLTHGLVYLYGENITSTHDVNFDKVQQCMASIGWKVVVNPMEYKPSMLPYLLAIQPTQDSVIRVTFEPL